MTKIALIISHGQPSDPGPAAAELSALAGRVQDALPGWQIGSATLAEADALAKAVAELGPEGVAYPLFMAGGWFTRVHLPPRLAAAGGTGWRVLEPMGCDPAIHSLALQQLRKALGPGDCSGAEIVIAAHGSSRSSAPSDIARLVAAEVRSALNVDQVQAAFIDQSPRLADLTPMGPAALCLPFFAAAGGHVTDDLPQALAAAGFQGRILPALGLDPAVPRIIAAAIVAGVPVCAAACRYSAA
jgi:sirohydrochlorin ferrochelatase